MTSTEKPRNPTAKELAEQAVQLAEQAGEKAAEAATTAAQTLAEFREYRESGTTAPQVSADGLTYADKVEALERDVVGLLEDLNKVAQAKVSGGYDDTPLRAEIKAGFDAYNESLTAHGRSLQHVKEDTEKALALVRDSLAGYRDNPPGAHSMATLHQDMDLIGERLDSLGRRLDLFDEAGLSPATAEDTSALDKRLRAVEAYLGADGPVAAEHGTAPTPGVPAIYRQMHQLMVKVAQLGKDGQADEKMGGYAFRSIDAAMDAVGHALREVGMMFIPGPILDHKVKQYEITKHFNNGGSSVQNWTHVWVRQSYSFISLIDGSRIDGIEMDGEARDNGDKSTSKADSMRYKYALLQALCIPTKGLPESDGRDGSEGADWGSAPPVGSGQGQQQRPQAQRPPQDEPSWDDTPSGPPPGYREATPQDAVPDQPPAENVPEHVMAARVYAAIQAVNTRPPAERQEEFLRIARKVADQRLGGLMHDGVTLNAHLTALNGTLRSGT